MLRVDVSQFRRVSKMLRAVSNSKELRKRLLLELRPVADDAANRARDNIRGMASGGGRHPGGSLRGKVAKRVQTKATLGGKRAGVRVMVARRVGLPRGFFNAPAQLNRPSFRHPVFQTERNPDTWVAQKGAPGWFDDPMRAARGPAGKAAAQVLDRWAQDLAREIDHG